MLELFDQFLNFDWNEKYRLSQNLNLEENEWT